MTTSTLAPSIIAPAPAAAPAPLYLIRADINIRQFHRWAGVREIYARKGGVFDEGLAMHKLVTEMFGDLAPRPFRIITPRGGSRGSLYGYAAADAAELRRAAHQNACPLQMRALPPALFDSKLMPAVDEWSAGRRLGFEVLLRPVVRTQGKRERDAFLRPLPLMDEKNPSFAIPAPSREDMYAEWLESRLERGGARLEEAALAAFRLIRLYRMNKPMQPGPHALMRGVLAVADPARFAQTLAKGVGKHKAYGYGMLLLRPSYRSDINGALSAPESAGGWRRDDLRHLARGLAARRAIINASGDSRIQGDSQGRG